MWRGYEYCRLDGQTPHEEREVRKMCKQEMSDLHLNSLVNCCCVQVYNTLRIHLSFLKRNHSLK